MAKLKHYAADAPRSLSDILLFEIDPRYSREHGEFAPTTDKVPMGAVLSLNEKGQYIPFGQAGSAVEESVKVETASEGTEPKETSEVTAASEDVVAKEAAADKPCAILISREIEASEEAQDCAVIRRGACVASANLFWLPSVSDEQKKTALAALADLGIVSKE